MSNTLMAFRCFAAVVVTAATVIGVRATPAQRGETYAAATLGNDGALHILTTKCDPVGASGRFGRRTGTLWPRSESAASQGSGVG